MPSPDRLELAVADLPTDVFALVDSGREIASLTAGELSFQAGPGRSCGGCGYCIDSPFGGQTG